MHVRTKLTIGLLLGAIALAIAVQSTRRDERRASAPGSGASAERAARATRETPGPSTNAAATGVLATASSAVTAADAGPSSRLATARWGSGRGDLGRERQTEGNAEGPMSFTLAGRDLVVLDQVNGRLVRYDASGRVVSSSEAPGTVQDVAVAANGTAVLLDRLAGKTITLTDASGKRIGELPLTSAGDPGMLTGVFVDGRDVYVEKEHGALVRVGTTDGQPSEDAKELVGRPSKDGVLLVSATITAARQGRVAVNAFDRKKDALRFARLVQVPAPALGIVMLDTDARGIVYLGVASGAPETAHVACLDPIDGHVVGRVSLPLSRVPEESFRDFAVGADGTIVYAVRTDDGVDYFSARCP